MTACGITRKMTSRLRQFSQLQKLNQASILTPNSGNILMTSHVISISNVAFFNYVIFPFRSY